MNNVPFFEEVYYIKKELYSNFWTFEIASLVNVSGHYLRKYGIFICKNILPITSMRQAPWNNGVILFYLFTGNAFCLFRFSTFANTSLGFCFGTFSLNHVVVFVIQFRGKPPITSRQPSWFRIELWNTQIFTLIISNFIKTIYAKIAKNSSVE